VLDRRTGDIDGDRVVVRSSIVASVIALNLAWLVNSAIVITAAGAFYEVGLPIESIEDAHRTLEPLLGAAAATAFAIALLAAGLSSSTTATLAGQVIIEGFLDIRFGLFLRRAITVVPAILVIAAGLDAYLILILSQVALSIQLPFAIVPLVWLTSRRSVMGGFVNRRLTTGLAALAGLVIIGLNVVLLQALIAG
jgi:manganese transport protein